jgi:hypothetical protein
LDGNNNRISGGVINNGHIAEAELMEVGVKGSFFNNKLFITGAFYEQTRIDVTVDEDAPLGNANIDSTFSKGWELEIKWVPVPAFFTSFYITGSETKFQPNGGGNILVDARLLGFQDVLDADGNVVYPAEAFLYGGRSQIALPDRVEGFEIKSGVPDLQIGFSAGYDFESGISVTFSGNHFSEVNTGRLGWTTLPSYTIYNSSIGYKWNAWTFRLNAFNLENKRHFKPRTGETLGDVLAQAMPGRRIEFSARYDF